MAVHSTALHSDEGRLVVFGHDHVDARERLLELPLHHVQKAPLGVAVAREHDGGTALHEGQQLVVGQLAREIEVGLARQLGEHRRPAAGADGHRGDERVCVERRHLQMRHAQTGLEQRHERRETRLLREREQPAHAVRWVDGRRVDGRRHRGGVGAQQTGEPDVDAVGRRVDGGVGRVDGHAGGDERDERRVLRVGGRRNAVELAEEERVVGHDERGREGEGLARDGGGEVHGEQHGGGAGREVEQQAHVVPGPVGVGERVQRVEGGGDGGRGGGGGGGWRGRRHWVGMVVA